MRSLTDPVDKAPRGLLARALRLAFSRPNAVNGTLNHYVALDSELCPLHTPGMAAAHEHRAPPDDASAFRVDSMVRGILSLLETLSPAEKQLVVRRVTDALRPIRTPNAGDVLGVVVQLMPRTGTWTVEDLKKTIEKSGVEAKPKEIYNALGYLTRRKHIQRISYGRYMVDGAMIETSEDLGESNRYEEAYQEQS